MDRRIRQVAAMITALLLAVTAMAGWVQGVRADFYANHEPVNPRNPEERARNPFHLFQECIWERGLIVSADGQELARSVPAEPGRRCRFLRIYPSGDLAPHVVGQWSLHYPKTGLEADYNEQLVGQVPPPRSFGELLTEREPVGATLQTTIDTRLQRAAVDALAGRRGGIVALNPKTGAVLVAASVPSYDPTPLASNDREEAARARCSLGIGGSECRNPNSPMVSVALQARRAAGSSFKVVTAAAAMESADYEPGTRIPSAAEYLPPGGGERSIGNYGSGACGGTLTQALTVSCNTAFARVAVDVGADGMLAMARGMGLDQFGGSRTVDLVGCDAGPYTDVSATRTGCLPERLVRHGPDGDTTEKLSSPGFLARAGIGQWVIQVSPLGMALVAGTVANGGSVPRPRFADRVIYPLAAGRDPEVVRTGIGASAMSGSTAEKLQKMMRSVVTSGTARGAFGGFPVAAAGKTGTAQQPSCDRNEQEIFGKRCGDLPHAWFIAFAPMEDPAIAIAVLIERGGGNNEEATGGRVAAPVARKVLEAYFQLYPSKA